MAARKKNSLFSNVSERDVFSCHDAESILLVPQMLYDQGIINVIFKKFGKVGLVNTSANWDKWNAIINSFQNTKESVRIAMIGKYVKLADSYVSVNHALQHAGAKIGKNVMIRSEEHTSELQ